MTDIRPRAEEKAKQRIEASKTQDGQPGKAFQSERERAKNEARASIGSYDGDSVHKIAAYSELNQEDRILRVAAYCRVSTDDLEQVVSIELQKTAYRDKIKGNPQWRYAGTYVDDGFSGTNTDHRPGFQLMMHDAMEGRFDMIITKSVSRFARNLVDCVGWSRRLKEHDPPIAVFFEQENLNTLNPSSNIILFVLAMVAEEESHMKSEAMLLSLEWRLSRGRFLTPKLLGYDVQYIEEHGVRRKMLVVNHDEAQTVRLMYYMLLSGSPPSEIADTLTELQRPTGGRRRDGSPNTIWSGSGVTSTLRNERYCGDVLARKTWTPDFHTHKATKNRGNKNKYYQADHHEAIVTRAQWNAAQRILNSRRYQHTGTYLPMRVIESGPLAGYISMNRSWAGFEPDEYMRVSRIVMGLDEGEVMADLNSEHLPDGGHAITGMADAQGIQRIARELSESEMAIKAELEGITPEVDTDKPPEPEPTPFQVVSADMFSHAYEPVVRIDRRSIAFNPTCVSKFNRYTQTETGVDVDCCQYAELLFNPVERLLAVRPCEKDRPNAIRWDIEYFGASALCKILYDILGWDAEYRYRVPAALRRVGDSQIMFFDLDNYVGRAVTRKAVPDTAPRTEPEKPRQFATETSAIFYPADDDEPQRAEEIAELEARLREKAEQELRSFGTPAFEHSDENRFPDFSSEEEIDTETVLLDGDHSVPGGEIDSLYDRLVEQLFTPAPDPTEGGGE